MQNRSQAHGYESLMLILLVVVVGATIVSIFVPALHYGHINIVDSVRHLLTTLSSNKN